MQTSYSNPRSDPATTAEQPSHGTLFLVHIPGNAGGSIRKAFGQNGGNHRAYHHQTAKKLYQAFQSARTKQLFCVIRDPIERALKSWSWASRQTTWNPLVSNEEAKLYSALFSSSDPSKFFESVDFPALVSVCHHFTPQCKYLDLPGEIDLISFDALQEGLDGLVDHYGGEQIVLGDKKVHASNRPSSEFISNFAKERILDFYKNDLALYERMSENKPLWKGAIYD
jgi:hypothetical protein